MGFTLSRVFRVCRVGLLAKALQGRRPRGAVGSDALTAISRAVPRQKLRDTAVAETEVLVFKVRNLPLRGAPDTLRWCFGKAFIELLVVRLEATHEPGAEWDLGAAPPEIS